MYTLGTLGATVRLYDLFHDRETEPGSFHVRIGGELAEDFGQHLKRDARAVVADNAGDCARVFASAFPAPSASPVGCNSR